MAEKNNNNRHLNPYHLTVRLHGHDLPVRDIDFGFSGARIESPAAAPLGAIVSVELHCEDQCEETLARVVSRTLHGFDAQFIEPGEGFVAMVMDLITPQFAANASPYGATAGDVIEVDFKTRKIVNASAA